MTLEEFRLIAMLIFGNQWITPMATEMDMTRRHMQRIANGETSISPAIADTAIRLLRARRDTIDWLLKNHDHLSAKQKREGTPALRNDATPKE